MAGRVSLGELSATDDFTPLRWSEPMTGATALPTWRSPMLTSPSRPTPVSIPDLRAVVQGRVIEPTDADYDAARGNFYGGFDRRPAAVLPLAGPGGVPPALRLPPWKSTEPPV